MTMEEIHILFICSIVIHCFYTTVTVSAIQVTIDQGTLEGYETQDYFGNSYYGFKGIPYAEPPLAKLRFKSPKPAQPWSGILNATIPANICTQRYIRSKDVSGSEDCLYLEVYTKSVSDNKDQLKSIMVWIHGGYLEFGSTRYYSPDFLMTEDIVLVLVQYRLTILGYLNINDPDAEIPGNAGFKDQILALKWIQKNIDKFGGNPNSVTIFGESAGAVAVHLLVLSTQTKGLFHKAIAQSGTADILQAATDIYQPLSEMMGCNHTEIKQLVECLQECPVEDLLTQTELARKYSKTTHRTTGYTIEPETSPDALITKPLDDIIKSGDYNQVPFIIGYVTDEGVIAVFRSLRVQPNTTNYEKFVPLKFGILDGTNESIATGNKIKEFYYGNKNPSYDNIKSYINYHTDALFVYSIYKYAKKHVDTSKAPIYFYHFDYFTTLNSNCGRNSKAGLLVCHADDVHYLFISKDQKFDAKSDEFIGAHRLIKLWTSFAKCPKGNPNPPTADPLLDVEWKPITFDTFNYLEISSNLSAKVNPAEDRMKLWESIDPNP